MGKKMWSGKTRYEKQGYYSLFTGGPKVSKKVHDEHMESMIDRFIEKGKSVAKKKKGKKTIKKTVKKPLNTGY